jgi:hypothetical protein
VPFKDPEKAREAKRLSAQRRRAAMSSSDIEAVREADSSRKAAERQGAQPRRFSEALSASPYEDPGSSVLVDKLSYNRGTPDGVGQNRRGYYRSYRRPNKYAAPPSSPRPESPGRRRARARAAVIQAPGADKLWREELEWATYALLKLDEEIWDAGVPQPLAQHACEVGRVLAATMYNLPPIPRRVALAIRRGAAHVPSSPDYLRRSCRLTPAQLDAALDYLERSHLLEFSTMKLKRQTMEWLPEIVHWVPHQPMEWLPERVVVGYGVRTGGGLRTTAE